MSAENVDLGFDPTLKKKKKKSTKSFDESVSTPKETTPEVDDVLSGLKKKKKKSKDDSEKDDDSKTTSTDDITEALGELKLKKKKKKTTTTLDDFDKQLEKAGVLDDNNDTNTDNNNDSNNNDSNSNINNKDSSLESQDVGLPYNDLLSRFFKVLSQNNPELAGDRSGSKFRIPPPICQREGNKKTAFANVQEIADKLQRSPEHVIQYLFAELGTSGSVDGQKRLIIRGRFQPKQIENVLRRYIIEYVTCKTCKSINTQLRKESSNRLFFLVCNSCGSTRSVSSIKTGFQANVGRKKKLAV
ncbi:hypothetical protein WICMUC_003029 [Wickerhamomyces mucosus]|uniref:Translation initiation factor IF2/IF5 domain-containing protein n=1 Tax=Wickerhamomyces mucosus TaxID=1378264 RepID=A0A9P8TDY4_9ASCO|nr:hypothetical protein WICMUC_003029 [Wickerhamomyces mucosus]